MSWAWIVVGLGALLWLVLYWPVICGRSPDGRLGGRALQLLENLRARVEEAVDRFTERSHFGLVKGGEVVNILPPFERAGENLGDVSRDDPGPHEMLLEHPDDPAVTPGVQAERSQKGPGCVECRIVETANGSGQRAAFE